MTGGVRLFLKVRTSRLIAWCVTACRECGDRPRPPRDSARRVAVGRRAPDGGCGVLPDFQAGTVRRTADWQDAIGLAQFIVAGEDVNVRGRRSIRVNTAR